jgi:lipoate---protein ligase
MGEMGEMGEMAEMASVLAPRPIRVLSASAEPAAVQLASSLALIAGMERTGLPVMRWYEFHPPALLLGSAQRLEEVDGAASAAAGVPVHKRRSGGGLVQSEGLLLLDLGLPPGDPLFTTNLTDSYRWLGEVWVVALKSLGFAARVVPVEEARADTQALDPLLKRVCFGGRSPYEVLVGERKVVGLAQVRRRGGALYQAGVYLHWDAVRSAALLAASDADRARLSVQLRQRVAGLSDFAPAPPSRAALIRAVEAALSEQAGLMPLTDDWTDREREAREDLLAQYQELVFPESG